MLRLTFGFLLALVASAPLAPAPAAAQRPPELQLLALPIGRTMACRTPEADLAAALPVRPTIDREFLFDPYDRNSLPPGFPLLAPRTVLVMFDSTGVPLVLTDDVESSMDGAEHAMVIFAPDGRATGMHVRITIDSAMAASARASGDLELAKAAHHAPVTRELTFEETTRALELAQWLWPRRCPGI